MNKADKKVELTYPFKKYEDDNGDRYYRITLDNGDKHNVSQFIGDLLHQLYQENKELKEKVENLSISIVSKQRELLKAFQSIKGKEESIDLRNLTDSQLDKFIEAFNFG